MPIEDVRSSMTTVDLQNTVPTNRNNSRQALIVISGLNLKNGLLIMTVKARL